MSARILVLAARAFVLCVTAACNLVLGLDAGSERGAGGGGAAVGGAGTGASGGGEAGGDPEGGGGATSSGGEGGVGGEGGSGGCPPEESAGAGREIVVNGSFEDGVGSWVPSSLPPLALVEGFCGCQAGEVELPGGYGELRNVSFTDLALGTTVRARARLRAPDSVAAELTVRGSNNNLEPPAQFLDDADDPEGADGWRLAEIQWTVTPFDFDQTYTYIALDGASGVVVAFDCISVTIEP